MYLPFTKQISRSLLDLAMTGLPIYPEILMPASGTSSETSSRLRLSSLPYIVYMTSESLPLPVV